MPYEFTNDHPYVGREVTYDGDNRRAEFDGLTGIVKQVGINPSTGAQNWGVAFPGYDKLIYAASWAWSMLNRLPVAIEEPVHAKAIEAIDAELAKLNERKASLEAARKVLESL